MSTEETPPYGSGLADRLDRRRRADQADPHPPPAGDEAARREVRDAHRLRAVRRADLRRGRHRGAPRRGQASNNVFANETSLPVTVDELIPLARAVSRSVRRALVVADLPFGSYQASPEQAYLTAVRFMKEANAHAVKLEGGDRDGAAGPQAHRGRHPGDGPHRLHPPVRAPPRRLPGPGPRRRGGPGGRGGPGDGGRRGVRGGHGDGPGRRRHRGHQGASRSPRSASAPVSTATARCSSGRTPSASAPAGCRASSSSTPTCTACCSRRPAPTPTTSAAAPSPASEHTF